MHAPNRNSVLPLALFTLTLSAAQPAQAQLAAKWLGQDGHDLVGGKPGPSRSDYQDIHFAVRGIPANRKVVETIVRGHGGGEWKASNKDNNMALLVRKGSSTSGDVYVEPYQRETGREFEIHFIYDNGVEDVAVFAGGKADPNRRAPGSGVEVRWAGQDGLDRTGPSPNVGPDGIEDAHLTLARLSAQSEIKAVAIEGPGGLAWSAGPNPKGHPAAELARPPGDKTRADVFFTPGVDLAGKSLQVTVTYADDRTDVTSVAAGKCNPAKPAARTPAAAAPARATATAKWLGQDGVEISPGDVHVALEGLAAGRSIVAAALSDSVAGTWVFKSGDKLKFDAGPITDRLNVRRTGPTRADLVFPPIRDESGATMTLRLLDQAGREEILRFPGGAADVDRRAPALPPGSVAARPGDDLNALAARFGTITLAKGTYPLAKPLILGRPTRIVGEAGATLRFAQAPGEPKWTAAIKVHAGGTTLEGFAVRFAGPVRWDQEVSFGPAVIASTDDRDQVPYDPKYKLLLARLDLEGPPPSSPDWEMAPHLIRVTSALSGRLERNTLRGGTVAFANGPWTIAENVYKGTPPNTFSHGVFSGRYTHDLVLAGNRARPEGPSGKTWRFLILTQRGMFDTVRGNVVEGGIGPREDDPKPHPNAPEQILTEAYRLHFEGKPTSISGDGRHLTIPTPQGGAASTGDAVAILSGSQAGQWRSIAQALGPHSYLLDEPIAKDTDAVSIATAFVRETFEGNTVDCRGSGIAADLVLAGNLFGVRVLNNRFLGGGESIRLLSTPTEEPVHWGWSHAPFLGGVFRGNTLEDAPGGGIGVEHGSNVRSNRGRVYMSLDFQDNTLRWTKTGGKTPRLQIGFGPTIDAGELVLTEGGTKLEGAPPEAAWVHAATVNGRAVKDAPLKSAGTVGARGPARRN